MLTDSPSPQVERRPQRRRWLGPLVFLIVAFACVVLMFVTMRQVALYEELREIDRAWIDLVQHDPKSTAVHQPSTNGH